METDGFTAGITNILMHFRCLSRSAFLDVLGAVVNFIKAHKMNACGTGICNAFEVCRFGGVGNVRFTMIWAQTACSVLVVCRGRIRYRFRTQAV